jgi:hypothetical protein
MIPEVYPTQRARPAVVPGMPTSPSRRADGADGQYPASSSSAYASGSVVKSPAAIIIPFKRTAHGSGGDGRLSSSGGDRSLYPSYLGLERPGLSTILRQLATNPHVSSSDPTATPGLRVELPTEDRRQPALVPFGVTAALSPDRGNAVATYPTTQ